MPLLPVCANCSPTVLTVVSDPPSKVSVGEVFEMLVFVGLSASAPLPNTPVSLSLTPAALGDLKESVDAFVRRLSGQPGIALEEWVSPLLDPASSSAVR
jgi:hypothetical protein